MVEHQKEYFGWEFLFLGANINAIESAVHFGIKDEQTDIYYANKMKSD